MITKLIKTILITVLFAGAFQLTGFAQPCFTGYKYRTPVVVNNSGGSLLNYQLKVELNTATLVAAGKMSYLGKDIRVLDRKGNELNYWIEDGSMNTSTTQLWIKTDAIIGYGKDTLYIFYGNSSATAKSDASQTFDGYDDFNGSSLSSAWTTCGSGSVNVSGGKLTLTSSSNTIQVKRSSTLAVPIIMEVGVTSYNNGKAAFGAVNSSGNGYATSINSATRSIDLISNASCFTTSVLNSSSSSVAVGVTSFSWISTGSQMGMWSSGSVNASNSTYSQPSSIIPFVGITGTGSVEIDYIRLRKYASTTPTVSLLAEVNMNFTISPTYKAPLCEDGTLELTVSTITGATYKWSGPNSFVSNLQNPKITGVTTSDAGRYDLTVTIPSGCASQSSSVNVNISPKAKGGTVSGTQSVCSGSNSGVLSLSGHTGNVTRWDSAHSASGPWYPISNTQLNQNYQDLSKSTFYRAIVSNGNCSQDSSISAKITVTAPSDGGTLNGSTQVCAGSNSGVLVLSGYTGNIVRWEYSENGNLWYSIVNKGTSHAYNNLSTTMYYRAVVQNGNCNVDYSSLAKIQVDQASVGGTLSGSQTVCPDDNSGLITLSGNKGSVVRWEQKPSSGWSWTGITSTSDSLTFNNLSETTAFRAVIQNGSCTATESATVTITVYSKSNAGTLSGGTTVCEGSNSGTLTLTGLNGSVLKWQSSNSGTTWSDISSTANTYNWYNLGDTMFYRAIAANNGCKADTSNIETILVDAESINGYLTGTDQVCITGNTVTLGLNGQRGNIEKWEYSTSGYAPWTDLGSTANSLTEKNLTQTKYYRVVVRNGVCPKATTTSFKVNVDAVTKAGSAGPNIDVCEGTNFGIINLSGSVGDILKWQSSDDLSSGNWTDINNTTGKQEFQNLNKSNHYRAIVQNGSCSVDTSKHATIDVSNYTVAGTLVGEAGYCSKTNNGQIKLVGYAGDIQNWETSINGGSQWIATTNNSNSFSYTDLDQTTLYRVVVRNGVCDQLTSNTIQVEIADLSFAGNLSSDNTTLCKGANFGTVNVTKQIGDILNWEYKTASGVWTEIKNTSAQQSFYNLEEATSYRVIAQNRFCRADTSMSFTFDISENTFGGQIKGLNQACTGDDKIILSLNDQVGSILEWQKATTPAGPWSAENVTDNWIEILQPSQTMFYRAKVVSGVCPIQLSAPFKLEVFEKTVGGSTTGGGEVCAVNNNGTIELLGQLGQIVRWEARPLSGSNWTIINSTTETFEYAKIDESMEYRAVVQNGVCEEVASEISTIITNPNPTVGIIHDNLCDGEILGFKQNASISAGFINTYQWRFSDGFTSTQDQFDKSFLIPGKYGVELEVVSDKGCVSSTTENLIVSESPQVFFRILKGLSPSTGCLHQTTEFENNTSHSDVSSIDFTWNFGNGETSKALNPDIKYSSSGTYNISLKAVSRTGCVDSFSAEYVIFDELKPVAGNDVTISKGIGTQLNATGSVMYSWTPAHLLNDPNVPNPIAHITESTEFVVTGTDYFGCKSSDTIMLNVIEDYKVIPNNVITPDGNGGNDVWIIKNLENYPENKVAVFDRWGREVFSTISYDNDWGATNKDGQILMDGTYYYVLEFPGADKVLKGAITVIKNR